MNLDSNFVKRHPWIIAVVAAGAIGTFLLMRKNVGPLVGVPIGLSTLVCILVERQDAKRIDGK